ncbi:MAG: 50S ribosomal protein L6 [Candidatus Pacebacteria bacterium CG10_big_fil_rev_8_21_14_0_10_36_11]|nr:50S ribosomal protein L6 [Candidatus Pacearchaeota archaeon]OIP73933.1 MAG: 50S ribosomal protein L6 [Candidatus Pacebacteria bacterium CG2_30_36_39]PIR65041.1 MAG: 50S ribosomal protein L6 [Candidatus Pacebacteria bacterium CG10_big_fil_rev_8_21_14_0_10_36_11]PJC42857.1 MAG: 50S ribosomal protein L6 [Candidatus Pacebacteria bacterium CG_4_9_14_0_2_um_filter_36_8]
MSRIGKKPIVLPAGVTAVIEKTQVTVKGPKGSLVISVMDAVTVAQEENTLVVTRKNDERQSRAFHGLVRSLLAGAVEGVSVGFKKTLKLVGTGYRATAKGAGISITVGYSHPVDVAPVEGVKFSVEGTDTINIEGISKVLVGQTAANIRGIRSPEPYKGKGIRYENEVVKTKPGKTATA